MSKCEKCGAVLRSEGDCPYCSRAGQGAPQVPPMLRPASRSPIGPRTSAAPAPPRATSTAPRVLTSPPVSPAQPNATGSASGKTPALAGPATPPRHPTPVPNRATSSPNGGSTARPVAPQLTPRPPTPAAKPPTAPRVPLSTPPPSVQSDVLEEDPAEILFRLPEPKRTTTTETVHEVRAQPAPIWRRFLAWLFDGSLILLVVGGYLRIAAAILGVKPAVTGLTGLDYWARLLRRLDSRLAVDSLSRSSSGTDLGSRLCGDFRHPSRRSNAGKVAAENSFGRSKWLVAGTCPHGISRDPFHSLVRDVPRGNLARAF